jgi:CRP/FNR family cyclic AMP-dependent transcriptional regulator
MTALEAARSLRRVVLFRDLTDKDLAWIADKAIVRRHPPQDELLNFLDDTSDVYYVLEGRLRVTLYSHDGKETIFRDIGEGELFGELAAIDGRPRSANVVALTECLVATMTSASFQSLVTTNPTVCMALMQHLTRQVRTLTERVYQLGTWTVRYRLFAELLKLGRYGQAGSEEIVIRNFPTHGEIASRISTHREAVSKELSQLTKAGVIQQQGRTLVIRKPAFLADHLHLS